MKLTAEESVAFLHVPVNKLTVLEFLDTRCLALENAEPEFVSALDDLSKNGMDDEYLECYADLQATRHELETCRELFVRVFENTFDDETYLSSYGHCRAAYIDVQNVLKQLNSISELDEYKKRLLRDLEQIELGIQKVII